MATMSDRKRIREGAFQASLASGQQRRLVTGTVNSGSGLFPMFSFTGSHSQIQAPAQYNISNIGKGASISIGSTSTNNSHNSSSSMSHSNNSTAQLQEGKKSENLRLNLKRKPDLNVDHRAVQEVSTILVMIMGT